MRCPLFAHPVRLALLLLAVGLLSLCAAAPAAADGIIIPVPPPDRPGAQFRSPSSITG